MKVRARLLSEAVVVGIVVALVAAFAIRRAGKPSRISDDRLMMGTIVSVAVFSEGENRARYAIDAAFDEIARVEGLTARRPPESVVARLDAGEDVRSPEVAGIVARSLMVSQETDGAFDITVAPLVDLWQLDEGGRLPEVGAIESALERVGYKRIAADPASGRIELPEGAAIDLDAIAKGYAVDRAVAVLAKLGIGSALVDAGGDIGFLGDSPHGSGWRVGIKHPREEGILGILTLEGGAVATSGDYQRFVLIDGVRYHHILDPTTGYPARGVVSVTVTAPTALQADALATAVFVLGPEKGMAFVERTEGVEAVIVIGDEAVEDILVSSGLEGKFETVQ